MRANGRHAHEMRPLSFETGYIKHHPGSVLTKMGDTAILVVVTSENRVPPHRLDQGGWLSAEYNMLPGSTGARKPRNQTSFKIDGRSIEIQRLIGRSLRQAINLDVIGQRTLLIDCDVLQADGGTRCAAITGAFVALCLHLQALLGKNQLNRRFHDIIKSPLAAVSLGVVNNQVVVDLDYQEDIKAETDCNLVARENGQIVEFQCTAERKPLEKNQMMEMLSLGEIAISQIVEAQKKILSAFIQPST